MTLLAAFFFAFEPGSYEIPVGGSSTCLPLKGKVQISGPSQTLKERSNYLSSEG